MCIQSLRVDQINMNGGTQSRIDINEDNVTELCDLFSQMPSIQNDSVPPIDLFYDGTTYWLADGFHRLLAAVRAKRVRITANVHSGTRRDALMYSCGANATHGLKRTNADKRYAVRLMLDDDEWAQKSDRWIADKCRVHYTIVSELRVRAVENQDACPDTPISDDGEARQGRDGKYRQVTSTAERQAAKKAAAEEKSRKAAERKAAAETKAQEREAKKAEREAEKARKAESKAAKASFDTAAFDAAKAECEAKDAAKKALPFAEKIKLQHREIESFCRRISSEFDVSIPSDPWLDDSRVSIARDLLKSCLSTIRIAKAHDQPCPKCSGSGCRFCKMTGYLPQNDYIMLGGQ